MQGRREHEGTIFEGLDPRRRTYYWIEEGRDRWVSDEMSDIHAVRTGLISITPAADGHHAPRACWPRSAGGSRPLPPGQGDGGLARAVVAWPAPAAAW